MDLAHQEQGKQDSFLLEKVGTWILPTRNRGNKTHSYQKKEEQGSCPPGTGETRLLLTRNRGTRILPPRNRETRLLPPNKGKSKIPAPPGAEEISFMPTRNCKLSLPGTEEARHLQK